MAALLAAMSLPALYAASNPSQCGHWVTANDGSFLWVDDASVQAEEPVAVPAAAQSVAAFVEKAEETDHDNVFVQRAAERARLLESKQQGVYQKIEGRWVLVDTKEQCKEPGDIDLWQMNGTGGSYGAYQEILQESMHTRCKAVLSPVSLYNLTDFIATLRYQQRVLNMDRFLIKKRAACDYITSNLSLYFTFVQNFNSLQRWVDGIICAFYKKAKATQKGSIYMNEMDISKWTYLPQEVLGMSMVLQIGYASFDANWMSPDKYRWEEHYKKNKEYYLTQIATWLERLETLFPGCIAQEAAASMPADEDGEYGMPAEEEVFAASASASALGSASGEGSGEAVAAVAGTAPAQPTTGGATGMSPEALEYQRRLEEAELERDYLARFGM